MRKTLLAALTIAGLGVLGVSGASAAPVTGGGVLTTLGTGAVVQDVQYRPYRRHYRPRRYCRTFRVCNAYGSCHWRTRCYR